MKKVLLLAFFLVISTMYFSNATFAQDDPMFKLCNEQYEGCKADCDVEHMRPLKNKKCKKLCKSKYHDCREAKLIESEKQKP